MLGDESARASDRARNSFSHESQITLLASDSENNTIQDKSPRSCTWLSSVTLWAKGFWASYLKKSWTMYLFLVAGTAFAVGHYFFYLSLDRKEAKQQSLMLRYGTILAFCSKASLGAAAVTAHRQRAWRAVRQQPVRLGAIDSIFTAAEDILALFDWKAAMKAKVATCMAIYIWLTPLIVVLTSDTLSVVGGTMEESVFCPEARTLNFSREEFLDWRHGLAINDIHAHSLSLFNTTTYPPERQNPESFDYYHGASTATKALVQRSMLLGQAVVRENAAREVCTVSWNCSYVVDFVGPGYKCSELASGVRSKPRKLGNSTPPFGTDIIVPEGNFSYHAVTDGGEYADQQIDSGPGGIPLMKQPYPKNLGAFRTEPVIWIGYATVGNYSKLQPPNRSSKGWYDAYTPKIIGCEHWEVGYKVEFNYTNGLQSYKIKHREYIGRVINTTYIPNPHNPPSDGTLDSTTATPERNYILARDDVRKYRKTAAYHSIGKQIRAHLSGNIYMPSSIVNSPILLTGLLTKPNFLPQRNLHEKIPEIYENVLISMLSTPELVAVSWAYNASIPTGVAVGGGKTRYPCLRSRPANFFVYNKLQICLVYAISISIAAIGVFFGVTAVNQEGILRDVKPSSIVEATSTCSLTEGKSSDQDIRKLKVRFGQL
ncbi:hypothetical protein BGZ63DRAFT_362038 [Mariannaea sp. PMI_226]|nr:hypothetical protein BGZ63DRAFT_362038 [Mariannaea sp. PMI_226]